MTLKSLFGKYLKNIKEKIENKKIDIYNPIIYPRKLYVMNCIDKDYINNNFLDLDDNEIELSNLEIEAKGLTIEVINKENRDIGVLICISNEHEGNDIINTISHESFHATFFILNGIEIFLSEDTNEAYAYLNGWINECVYKSIGFQI